MKILSFGVFAILTFGMIAPSIAADNQDNTISYTAKKQGRVHFKTDAKQDEQITSSSMEENFDPESIEPAAGGYQDDMTATGAQSVSDSIKLPRK